MQHTLKTVAVFVDLEGISIDGKPASDVVAELLAEHHAATRAFNVLTTAAHRAVHQAEAAVEKYPNSVRSLEGQECLDAMYAALEGVGAPA